MELIPSEMDWSTVPESVVIAAAEAGIPEALAELERRLA